MDERFFGAAKHGGDFVFAVKFEEFGGEIHHTINDIEQHEHGEAQQEEKEQRIALKHALSKGFAEGGEDDEQNDGLIEIAELFAMAFGEGAPLGM